MLSKEENRKPCSETHCFLKTILTAFPQICHESVSDTMKAIAARMRADMDEFERCFGEFGASEASLHFCKSVYKAADESYLNPFLAPFGVGEMIKRYCIIIESLHGVKKKKKRRDAVETDKSNEKTISLVD